VTIVRALLVPAAMKLFGDWNWYLPSGIARVFRVRASPLRTREPNLRPAGR
jgi:RND superfamily putative drug exporter